MAPVAGTRQPAKVAPFAGGNEATVRKSAAGDFFQCTRTRRFECILIPRAGSDKSLRIVEDDAQRVATTRSQPADSMTQVHAIDSASALHGTMMNRKHHAVALA